MDNEKTRSKFIKKINTPEVYPNFDIKKTDAIPRKNTPIIFDLFRLSCIQFTKNVFVFKTVFFEVL